MATDDDAHPPDPDPDLTADDRRVLKRLAEQARAEWPNRRQILGGGAAVAGGALAGLAATQPGAAQPTGDEGQVGQSGDRVEVWASEIDALEVATDRVYTDSRAPTVAVHDDGSTYYADGPDESVATGSDAGSLIDTSLTAIDSTGGQVFLQSATRPYLLDSTVSINQHAQTVRGACGSWFFDSANRGVQLRSDALTSGNLVEVGPSATKHNIRLDGFDISGTGNSVTGLWIDSTESAYRDLYVKECADTHLHLADGNGNYLYGLRIGNGAGTGIVSVAGANDTQIHGGTVNRCDDWGLFLEGQSHEVTQLKVWNNGGSGSLGGLALRNSENNRFVGCEFDNPDTAVNARVYSGSSSPKSEVVFVGCWFWNNSGVGPAPSIGHVELSGDGDIDVGFIGCHFEAGCDAIVNSCTGTVDATATGCYIGEQSSAPSSVNSAGNYGPASF